METTQTTVMQIEIKFNLMPFSAINIRTNIALKLTNKPTMSNHLAYKKRKKDLISKVSELSTNCGVEACAIIYSQYDSEPEVWPSPLEAQSTLAHFRKLSEVDQNQRITKASEQLRRLQKENTCRELEAFMFRCITGKANIADFDPANLPEMQLVINNTLMDIRGRLDAFAAQKQRSLHAPPPQQIPPQSGRNPFNQ